MTKGMGPKEAFVEVFDQVMEKCWECVWKGMMAFCIAFFFIIGVSAGLQVNALSLDKRAVERMKQNMEHKDILPSPAPEEEGEETDVTRTARLKRIAAKPSWLASVEKGGSRGKK